MIYTLNSFELPYLFSSKALKDKSVYSNFTEMAKIKEKYTLTKMIQKSKITNKNILKMLYSIAEHISDLKFD